MKYLFNIIIFVFIIKLSFSQSFSHLQEYNKNGHVLYDPAITVLIDKIVDEDGYTIYHLMKTKINKNSSQYYLISFDEGPSYDPSFDIYLLKSSGDTKLIKSIGAEKLVIPGNGNIYSSGRVNQLYNKRKKFKLSGESLTEVDQGAYYIGLKTITNKTITLFSDTTKTKKTAVLPKNYSIEVLIEKKGFLLIKTPFGLTGWVKIDDLITYSVTGESLSIKDLHYVGD